MPTHVPDHLGKLTQVSKEAGPQNDASVMHENDDNTNHNAGSIGTSIPPIEQDGDDESVRTIFVDDYGDVIDDAASMKLSADRGDSDSVQTEVMPDDEDDNGSGGGGDNHSVHKRRGRARERWPVRSEYPPAGNSTGVKGPSNYFDFDIDPVSEEVRRHGTVAQYIEWKESTGHATGISNNHCVSTQPGDGVDKDDEFTETLRDPANVKFEHWCRAAVADMKSDAERQSWLRESAGFPLSIDALSSLQVKDGEPLQSTAQRLSDTRADPNFLPRDRVYQPLDRSDGPQDPAVSDMELRQRPSEPPPRSASERRRWNRLIDG